MSRSSSRASFTSNHRRGFAPHSPTHNSVFSEVTSVNYSSREEDSDPLEALMPNVTVDKKEEMTKKKSTVPKNIDAASAIKEEESLPFRDVQGKDAQMGYFSRISKNSFAIGIYSKTTSKRERSGIESKKEGCLRVKDINGKDLCMGYFSMTSQNS